MTSFKVRPERRANGSTTYRVVAKVTDTTKKGGWREETMASRIASKREAEAIKRTLHAEAQLVRAGAVKVSPTVDDAIDAYLVKLAGRPAHDDVERYARLHIRPALGLVELDALERPAVQALKAAKLAEGADPQMVRHVLGMLRASINHALDTGTWKGINPAARPGMPKLKRKVKLTLSADEMRFVLPHVADVHRPFTALVFYELLRPGELRALKKQQLRMGQRAIAITRSGERDQTKTLDERLIPIPEAAVPWFEEALRRSGDSPFVFPYAQTHNAHRDRKMSEVLRHAMVEAARAGGPSSLVTGWTLCCRRQGCGYRLDVDAVPQDGERCSQPHPKDPTKPCGYLLWGIGHARRVRYYALRSSGTTALLDAGARLEHVSQWLGHSTPLITLRDYDNASVERLREAAAKHVPMTDPGKTRDTRGAPMGQMKQRGQR